MLSSLIRATLVAAAIVSTSVHSADFSVARKDGFPHLKMTGEIRAGDYDKLLTMIKASTGEFAAAEVLHTESPGGNVEEAIKIAQLVEKLRYAVFVDEGKTCASACFFLLAAASDREIVGTVVVHRIYIPRDEYADLSVSAVTEATRRWTVLAKEFLDSYSIPNSITEHLLRTPSSSGHVLTPEEKHSLAGSSPSWEEVVIQSCQASNADMRNAWVHDSKRFNEMIACEKKQAFNARAHELQVMVGEEHFMAAIRDEIARQGFRQQADGTFLRQSDSTPVKTKQVGGDPKSPDDGPELWTKWSSIARAKGIPIHDPGSGIDRLLAVTNEILPALVRFGDRDATDALGSFYFSWKDYDASLRLFTHSAEAGSAEGMAFVGLQNLHGQGTPPDPVRGYAWSLLAFTYDHSELNQDQLNMAAEPLDRNQQHEGQILAQKLLTKIIVKPPTQPN